MRCFYHADADGQTSATWVYNYIKKDEYKTVFTSINYTDRFPIDEINIDEIVYIVDFSIQPNEMMELLDITKNVTWIDHHKTAIEKYDSFPYEIRGIRYDGVAGCELTYAYLRHMTYNGVGIISPFELSMLNDCPMGTRYIADYDVWKFEFEDTMAFKSGYELINPNPMSSQMYHLVCLGIESLLLDTIERGALIENYKKQQNHRTVKNYAYEVYIDGHKGLACNSTVKSSTLFGSKFDEYDFVTVYTWNGTIYTVSIYSSKIDVSKIAKKYGGGGHRGASGFTANDQTLRKIGIKI